MFGSRNNRPAWFWLPFLPLIACQGHESAGGGGVGGGGGSSDEMSVQIPFQRLPDAVVEQNNSGVPRNDPVRLRRIFCEDRTADAVIFYELVVSTHWHYLWLCSDNQPRRISSTWGANRLDRWLRGFKNQAVSNSAGCQGPAATVILRGSHESGIRAVAYCDGKIVLTFPDSGRSVRTFQSQAGGGGGGGGSTYADNGGSPGEQGCPPCPSCPSCPSQGSQVCPRCPPQERCPPAPRCPPPVQCPACDCSSKIMNAGQQGFRQGVAKACKSICQVVYDKCRSINPKTALCHMVSEECAEKCGK